MFLKICKLLLLSIILYSCSPINKQHGYLIDDFLMSSGSISEFSEGNTSKSDIYEVMGSPSIEIYDVNDVWIYLVSVKEKNVFEKDNITFLNIYRFEFDNNSFLRQTSFIPSNEFNELEFSKDKTRVLRDAYGITDQLYEAFTRGQN